jgi:integrase
MCEDLRQEWRCQIGGGDTGSSNAARPLVVKMIKTVPNRLSFSISQLLATGEGMPKPRYQNPPVRQSKNGTWFARAWIDVLTEDGPKRRQKTFVLGPPEIGKRKATTEKNRIMAEINRSGYMIQSQIRLSSFLEHYERAHISKLAASTRAKYCSHIKNHIRPAFQDLMLCEITTKRVDEWLSANEKLSWAAKTDIRNILSSIFTKATDWGHWSDRNPIERVHVGRKRSVREKRKLTDDQTRRLLAALPFDVRLMCCTGLFCTLRVSEILGLQEKHLNFDAGEIQVRQRFYRGDLDVAKNEKAVRDVPMGYLSEDLKRLCHGDLERFVFQIETKPEWGRKKGLCRDDRDILQHFLRPAAEALGFHWPGFGFHSLRREAVTAIGSVLGIGQALRMAGHSSADMSLLYTLDDKASQDRAVRDFQERILGKPEGKVN